MTTKHSNYDEMRGFADDAVCRFRIDCSKSGNAIMRLASMVDNLLDDIKQRQATEDNLRLLLKEVAESITHAKTRTIDLTVSADLADEIIEESAK